MQSPTLYRKRLIPMENVRLDKDHLLSLEDGMMITSWKTIRPKTELAYAYSCYYLDRGFKISRLYNHSHEFMYWYCDIIHTEYDARTDTYTFTDLLADVVVYGDGSYKILDLDELSEAFDKQLLSPSLMTKALLQLHDLLQMIYSHQFDCLAAPLQKAAREYPYETI